MPSIDDLTYRVTWGKAPPRGKAPLPSNYEFPWIKKFEQSLEYAHPWQLVPEVGMTTPRKCAIIRLELQISLKKSHLCQFLMDSKDLYIYGLAMTYTILQK